MAVAAQVVAAQAEVAKAEVAQVDAVVGSRARPVSLAVERTVPVLDALTGLFPEGGLQRGTTVAVTGQGAVSLTMALIAAPTTSGAWAAVVGLPALGPVAAAELGVDLARLALVPSPGAQWPTVVASLVDGFQVIVLQPPDRVRPVDARRLIARVRERGSVLVLVDSDRRGRPAWPESPNLQLSVRVTGWQGLGEGFGCLRSRRVEVVTEGRGTASRPRRLDLWLPGPDQRVAVAPARPAEGSKPVRPAEGSKPVRPPVARPAAACPGVAGSAPVDRTAPELPLAAAG